MERNTPEFLALHPCLMRWHYLPFIVTPQMPAPGKVLIVEDDVATRLLLQAIVTRHGLQAVVTADVPSAQALLAVTTFEAILLDLSLPGMSGADLLRELEQDVIRRVLIVTAMPPSEWRIHLDGVWGVIQKPFDIAELESALLACLAASIPPESESAGDQDAERVH